MVTVWPLTVLPLSELLPRTMRLGTAVAPAPRVMVELVRTGVPVPVNEPPVKLKALLDGGEKAPVRTRPPPPPMLEVMEPEFIRVLPELTISLAAYELQPAAESRKTLPAVVKPLDAVRIASPLVQLA